MVQDAHDDVHQGDLAACQHISQPPGLRQLLDRICIWGQVRKEGTRQGVEGLPTRSQIGDEPLALSPEAWQESGEGSFELLDEGITAEEEGSIELAEGGQTAAGTGPDGVALVGQDSLGGGSHSGQLAQLHLLVNGLCLG